MLSADGFTPDSTSSVPGFSPPEYQGRTSWVFGTYVHVHPRSAQRLLLNPRSVNDLNRDIESPSAQRGKLSLVAWMAYPLRAGSRSCVLVLALPLRRQENVSKNRLHKPQRHRGTEKRPFPFSFLCLSVSVVRSSLQIFFTSSDARATRGRPHLVCASALLRKVKAAGAARFCGTPARIDKALLIYNNGSA